MARELLIQTPDGQTKTFGLGATPVTVGRSSNVELCFLDDVGLSRQHFIFEPEGDDWTVRDLGSKNGTHVNNIPLKARLVLQPGDRITAGHLTILYDVGVRRDDQGVVVFEGGEKESATTSTVLTTLAGALSDATILAERGGQRALSPVQALIRAGQELSQNRPLEELFPVILDLAIKAVNAQRGVVMLLEGDTLVAKAHKGEGFRISTAVRDRVLNEKASVLVRDAQLDEAFKARMSIVEQRVHTMMAVPLETKDRIIGLIYVDSPFVLREFTKDDLSLLAVMANVAAIRIENVRLAEIEAADRIFQRDLSQAAEIQKSIMPAEAPEVAGFDLAGHNAACRTVGGDYYDFFPYGDGRVGLALGDVSGKGMPAALLAMALNARVAVLAADPGELGGFMTRLNKATCANCPSNRFITFFFSVIEPSGALLHANAGHNPPVLMRVSGEAEMLEGGGPPLGILAFAPYGERRSEIRQGDVLVIYSDGVTEANNPSLDEFGEARLIEVLRENRHKTAGEIVQAVAGAVTEFAAGAPQNDDITLLVAKRI